MNFTKNPTKTSQPYIPSYEKGGMVMKPTLKDDETRLAPYSELSRGKKQEMDLDRRAALEAAKKTYAPRPVHDAIVSGLREISTAPEKQKAEDRTFMAENNARRKGAIDRAQDEADYKDVNKPGRLYGDDVVHKLKVEKK